MTPLVFEEPTEVEITCPEYEGTGIALRCIVAYPRGSHIKATFNYGDTTSEVVTVAMGKLIKILFFFSLKNYYRENPVSSDRIESDYEFFCKQGWNFETKPVNWYKTNTKLVISQFFVCFI